MCELPQMDLLLEEIVIPPTPEPSTIEVHDPYVDDWAESQLYSYAYKLNYDRMVKKKLIKETISKRPASSQSTNGMTAQQRMDYNLNPENLAILSYMECDYGQNALRKKTSTYSTQEVLQDLYERA